MEVENYFDHLKTLPWFQNVGNKLHDSPSNLKIRRLSSWEETTKWAQHEITRWCNIESGNLLSASVRRNAPNQFNQWNQVAANNLPFIEELLNHYIEPNLPAEYRPILSNYIRSQLAGAFMEVYFVKSSNISLRKDQFKVYETGLFPCGWYVEAPEDFPEKSILVAY